MTSRWEQHAACVLVLSVNHHRPVKEIAKSGWRFTVKILIRFNIKPPAGETRNLDRKCLGSFLLISFRPDARRGSPPPQFLRQEAWLLPPPTPREWAEFKYLPLLLRGLVTLAATP